MTTQSTGRCSPHPAVWLVNCCHAEGDPLPSFGHNPFSTTGWIGHLLKIMQHERTPSIYQYAGLWLIKIAFWLLKASILVALAIVGYQLFGYLFRDGWISLSGIDGLVYLGSEWAVSPASFSWLHNFLAYMPLSLAVLLTGALLLVLLLLTGLDVMNWGTPDSRDPSDEQAE